MISAVIFSKDRACQLDLLLRSIQRNGNFLFSDITILYTYSNENYKLGYDKLSNRVSGVNWILETGDFRDKFLQYLETSQCNTICPFVDDDVFFREFNDAESVESLLNEGIVFSLRLGKNITVHDNFSNRPTEFPYFYAIRDNLSNKDIGLLWDKMQGHTPFGYPISVDGHFFKRTWLLDKCSEIEFKNPNFLEGNLQKFSTEFTKMASPIDSCVTSIPMNRVQSEFENRTIGEVSSKELNNKYLDNQYIDLDKMDFNRVNCTHSNLSYVFSC